MDANREQFHHTPRRFTFLFLPPFGGGTLAPMGESGGDGRVDAEWPMLELMTLRAQVAELQRAAARHEETEVVSLAERELLLAEVERVAHLGTWTWDLTSQRLTWSDELFRIYGLSPASASPSLELYYELLHPDDRERARESQAMGLRAGVVPPFNCRMLRPDGSVRKTTAWSSALFDSEGTLRGLVGAVLDRTEALEAEEKLRRTLSLLEEAQSFARLGSWRFSPHTGEVEWSTEFRRIVGLPPDVPANLELFLSRIVPQDLPRFLKRYEQTMERPNGGEIDGRLQLPHGEVRHIRVSGALVEGADGQEELRGTILDTTDQVRMREKLLHSQKMEAVGRLAGGIAHDFNNLLTIAIGNLELVQERLGDTEEIDEAQRALESAANLTRRLLVFGRKAQLSLKLVDPNELVLSTMTLMRRLLGDRIQLSTDLIDGPLKVNVDPLEIERALVNLVVNARDVLPQGGQVVISTRIATSATSPCIELSVIDDGPGIKDCDLPHIFEPFFTTRQGRGGTGMGLATVLGTVEQHGGTVHVSAGPGGRGSKFTITLPALTGEPVHSQQAEQQATSSDERTLCILVIDDDTHVAGVVCRLLSARGHEVLLATCAKDAQDIWKNQHPKIDLVLCDIVMPDTRGPQLIERLAQIGLAPCVLFMSGYNEEATHAQLGHPVIGKPFSSADLETAIFATLARGARSKV